MSTNHAEKEALREIFGDDWKKGMKEKPEIDSRRNCPASVATSAKNRIRENREHERRKMMANAVDKVKAKHSNISAKEANIYANTILDLNNK